MSDRQCILSNLKRDCLAISAALDTIDFHGQVAWIGEPYQHDAIHESVQDRLESMMSELDKACENA